jgi:hypothetical protein
MTEQLRTITRTLAERESTPQEREEWTSGLRALLPVHPGPFIQLEHDAEGFLALCNHLADRADDDQAQQKLIHAIVDAQQQLVWADPLLVDLDAIAEVVIERLFDHLAAEFARHDDPDTVVGLYRRLRDTCFGTDTGIVGLAAGSRHVKGRQIMEDFGETVIETAPLPMLRKLEAEGETGLLLEIISYDTTEAGALITMLEQPGRFVDTVLDEALSGDRELPVWVWYSNLLVDRFDLVRAAVPWKEVAQNAEPRLWGRIESHIRTELGDDLEAWETLRALENGFSGTLDELLTAARHL